MNLLYSYEFIFKMNSYAFYLCFLNEENIRLCYAKVFIDVRNTDVFKFKTKLKKESKKKRAIIFLDKKGDMAEW